VISKTTRHALEQRLYPDLNEVVFGEFETRLRACLGEGAVVLDAGSGPGSWVLQEQRERIDLLVGVDLYRPDTSQLDAFCLAGCDRLPFADDTFDVVMSYLVLEHLPEPARAYREIARVLKPGGCFCFKTPAVRTPLFLLARVLPTSLHKRCKASIGTAKEDVFPTYYRANHISLLHRQLSGVGLERDWLYTVDQTYAYTMHARWTYALGLLYSRLTRVPALSWLRNQIIGIYRKPEEMA
jgi:SAM-dependent methyltransferase